MKTRILLVLMGLTGLALVGCSAAKAPHTELYVSKDYFTLIGRADDRTPLAGNSARFFFIMHPQELNLRAQPMVGRGLASADLAPIFQFKAFRVLDGN